MGCGCGKKSVARPPLAGRQAAMAPTNGSSLTKAQTYQSATMRGTPIAPVTRKTV